MSEQERLNKMMWRLEMQLKSIITSISNTNKHLSSLRISSVDSSGVSVALSSLQKLRAQGR